MGTQGGVFSLPVLLGGMKKSLFVILLFLLSGVGGAEEKRFNVPIGDSPSCGPKNAPVTMVEFLDYQ
jgi:hypothetical protein